MLISCTSRLIILGIYGSRTEEARSSLPCVSIYGIDPSSRPLGARYVFALPSLSLYVHRPPFSPRFVCSAFCRYMPFSLIIFRMHADPARFVRPSPVTRLLYFRDAHRDARARSCERGGDLGLRNVKISSTYTRRFGRETRSYLVGVVGDGAPEYRITNFEFLRLISQSDSRREYLPVKYRIRFPINI